MTILRVFQKRQLIILDFSVGMSTMRKVSDLEEPSRKKIAKENKTPKAKKKDLGEQEMDHY